MRSHESTNTHMHNTYIHVYVYIHILTHLCIICGCVKGCLVICLFNLQCLLMSTSI